MSARPPWNGIAEKRRTTGDMSTVLFTWEFGGNHGHINRLSALASKVAANGLLPVLALSEQAFRRWRKTQWPGPVLAMPDTSIRVGTVNATASFAGILGNLAFHVGLVPRLRSWLGLLRSVRPISVVHDYSPTAMLASRILGVRAFQISNGFDSPPVNAALDLGGMKFHGQALREQDFIDTEIRRAEAILGSPPGGLDGLLSHAEKILDCLPELDPFGPRPSGLYVGPLGKPPSARRLEFPQHPGHRKRVFCYLRGVPWATKVIDVVQEMGANVICVWPDAEKEVIDRYVGPGTIVSRDLVCLDQLLPSCDLVVSYGSSTLSANSLLAGVPQLSLPIDIEKYVIGKCLERWRLGGIAVEADSPSKLQSIVGDLLHGTEARASALRVRSQYSGDLLPKRLASIMEKLCAS